MKKMNLVAMFSIPALAALLILQSSLPVFAEQASKPTYNEPVLESSPEKPLPPARGGEFNGVMWTVGALLAAGVGVAVISAGKSGGSTPANNGVVNPPGGGSNAGSATVAW